MWYCDTLIEIERGDSEKVLSDGNAKSYCNSWLGAPTPSISYNLAPSVFNLFLVLKKNLVLRCFGSNGEVKYAIKHFFLMHRPEFCKPIERYDKCHNILGT
ncbi:hypothetical protein TNCV_618751 [Trichonephila clavipes]|nr:hypothetical protein TNCV_618751 [Trichonephila clavipes]